MMILRPWRSFHFLGLILVLGPVGAWYKHVASPRYHTVGRASGLLMGVGRSPYLWRRALAEELEQSPDAGPYLPTNRVAAPWLRLQQYPAEAETWTALKQPHLASQGPPEKRKAGKRAFLPQASLRTRAVRTLLGVLQHQGRTPASRQKATLFPGLSERVAQKKEQPGTSRESRVFKPEI
ncbi:neuropeptide W [Sphaerodactylus townsendi]|uniref:Uncharacterized protein n=1 Tax=Sphaerodactylus townsendi TaxID=933632 RepID=A0ACB8FKI4_9SAUR|nr:neuropeptide W [Sphaerodactylus townsendi]